MKYLFVKLFNKKKYTVHFDKLGNDYCYVVNINNIINNDFDSLSSAVAYIDRIINK